MQLEFATTFDIASELAKRGLQFVIAIEVKDNKGNGIHLCTDANKDQNEVANLVAPLFNR